MRSFFSRNPAGAACVCAGLIVFASGPVGAATLVVDDSGGAPYTTIQSAIIAATPGVDDVFVNCGLYTENIVMKNGVSVSGAGARCTTIDGSASGSVVRIVDVGSATVLEGFTIRNGSAAQGGGLFIETSDLTVRNNVIENNAAVGSTAPNGRGGGIHIQTAFSLLADTAPRIEANVIRNNTAERFGGGINIDTGDGAFLVNNLIERNTAELAGGGLFAFTAFPSVVNNTFVYNCLQGAGTSCSDGGGGIALVDSGLSPIVNNVIAWNEAGSRGGGVDVINSSVTFDNNDVFGNTPANYFGVTDPTGTAGNISTDPLFADQVSSAEGYQPRSDSPLVEGGTGTLAPTDDIARIPRPLDGDADSSAVEDIGARENEGITRLKFLDRDNLVWDDAATTVSNLYRGDYQALLASCATACVYVQDTSTVAGARQWCDLLTPAATDMDLQPIGDLWFYLAVVNGAGANEGTLGFDGAPTERPFTAANSCP